MLNFNSINKTEKDIISSHDLQFKALCTAVRDRKVDALLENIDGYDLEKDDSYLARYAATIGSFDCFKAILENQKNIHRPEVIVAVLCGDDKECLDALGELSEDELSAEAFATAAFRGNRSFLDSNITSLIAIDDYQKYNLISIAARQSNLECLRLLLSTGIEFDAYDALVTAAANEDESIIKEIVCCPFFDDSYLFEGVVDAAIVAATYGNHKTLRAIFDNCGRFPVFMKDCAVGKAAICSECPDTVSVYIENGGLFIFDNALSIAAGLSGQHTLVGSNKIHTGNLELFKLVESTLDVTKEELRGTPLKTATAYGRTDIINYIESK